MRMITEKLKWRSSSKIEGIRIRKYREKKKKKEIQREKKREFRVRRENI